MGQGARAAGHLDKGQREAANRGLKILRRMERLVNVLVERCGAEHGCCNEYEGQRLVCARQAS